MRAGWLLGAVSVKHSGHYSHWILLMALRGTFVMLIVPVHGCWNWGGEEFSSFCSRSHSQDWRQAQPTHSRARWPLRSLHPKVCSKYFEVYTGPTLALLAWASTFTTQGTWCFNVGLWMQIMAYFFKGRQLFMEASLEGPWQRCLGEKKSLQQHWQLRAYAVALWPWNTLAHDA